MTETTTAIPKPDSAARAIWAQFRSHKGAVFGLVVLSLLIIAVLIGPYLWHPEKLTVVEAIKSKNKGPSLKFPLGHRSVGPRHAATDDSGGQGVAGGGFCRHDDRHRLRHPDRRAGGLLPPP